MKKEARIQALKMFLKAGGAITNRDIAKAVKVNPLTVGRWKREDDWESELNNMEEPPAQEAGAAPVRKKAAQEKALGLYLEAGGNVTNKDLARKVGVSPATISKWKTQDDWIKRIDTPEEVEEIIEEIVTQEESELDIGELAAPEQIIEINRRIDELLQRDYLSARDLADVAEAKSDLLEAVQSYIAIVREVGEIQSEE